MAGGQARSRSVRRYFQGEAAFPETEFVVRTARGQERIWRFRGASPEHLADGRRYSVTFAMDVTERKQAEAALRRAKEAAERANAAKSRFLAAASHDLRQPLQALDLQRAVLARRVADPEALQTLRELGLSIDVMRNTLDALLDLSQLETGAIKAEVGEFALDELFRRIAGEFRGLAAAKGLELKVVPTSAVVRSDPRLLERIVQNLVANAVKYTHAGKVLLGCRRRGGQLRIEVGDTGIGIAPDQLEAIFEEFYQVANAARERRFGLGLGLSIAHAAAKLLGSTLDVRSALGRGSSFAVDVPFLRRVAAAAGGARASASRPALRLRRRRSSWSRTMPRSAVPCARCSSSRATGSSTAASGREALALVERGTCRPAMAILDQNLPGGLSGVETVQRLRGADRAAPAGAGHHRRRPAGAAGGDPGGGAALPDQAGEGGGAGDAGAQPARQRTARHGGARGRRIPRRTAMPPRLPASTERVVHVVEDDAAAARSLQRPARCRRPARPRPTPAPRRSCRPTIRAWRAACSSTSTCRA